MFLSFKMDFIFRLFSDFFPVSPSVPNQTSLLHPFYFAMLFVFIYTQTVKSIHFVLFWYTFL